MECTRAYGMIAGRTSSVPSLITTAGTTHCCCTVVAITVVGLTSRVTVTVFRLSMVFRQRVIAVSIWAGR